MSDPSMPPKLILASKSASRRAILAGAGLDIEAVGSGVDEAAIKESQLAAGQTPWDIAVTLAKAKALAVSRPGALVIAGDQVLEFEGRLYDKPKDWEDAHGRLGEMAGADHFLRAGLVLAQDGDIVWEHRSSARMTMRNLTEQEIDTYLAAAGEDVLSTVGAYMLEGVGVRLFSAIEGDYFSILGLDLLPLLDELRRRGVIPW